MTGEFSDIHQAKYELMALGLPADLAMDFGATFRPQFIKYCAENGAEHTVAIDAHEAEVHEMELGEGTDFHKADFSRDSIVPWVKKYRDKHPGQCLGISFDTLLHQYDPLHVLRNLLGVLDRVCIGTPVLKNAYDSPLFLPAVPHGEQENLFPVSWLEQELETPEPFRFAPLDSYSWAHWLWGLSDHLLRIWVEREGFRIQEERSVDRPNAWKWWGCYATKGDGDAGRPV